MKVKKDYKYPIYFKLKITKLYLNLFDSENTVTLNYKVYDYHKF